jgi:hypothetical protein
MSQKEDFIHSRFIHSLKKNKMGMDRWGLNIPHLPSVPSSSGTHGNGWERWECMTPIRAVPPCIHFAFSTGDKP